MALAVIFGVAVFDRSGFGLQRLSLLPEVVSKDRKASPYRRAWRTSGQHAPEGELAFEQADGGFHPTAKLLQGSKPPRALMMTFL